MTLTDNLAIVGLWADSAELWIPEVLGEDLHLIAPLRVGRRSSTKSHFQESEDDQDRSGLHG
jgi:hypothetical protein